MKLIMKLITIIGTLLTVFGLVFSLRCHCQDSDDPSICKGNASCVSSSVCFSVVTVYHDGSYLNNVQYCPLHPFSPCLDHPSSFGSNYSIHRLCCNDRDFCNLCLNNSLLSAIGARHSLMNYNCSYPPVSPSVTTMVSIPVSTPTSTPLQTPGDSDGDHDTLSTSTIIYISFAALVVIVTIQVILVVLPLFLCATGCKRHLISDRSLTPESPISHEPSLTITVSNPLSDGLCSSSNPTILAQRTISDDVEKIRLLGEGSFGKVYLARYHSDLIAVKEFHPSKVEVFDREAAIYKTCMLSNEHILHFIASDQQSHFNGTCPMLLFDFHALGNLAVFLMENPMTGEEVVQMCHSLLSGLEFLHREIKTTNDIKPGIAHRDIKSHNILVRSQTSCCIGDLGLAVRHDGAGGVDRIPHSIEGTRRYLPPEVLANTMNYRQFASYKAGDIYSCSLVLWEIVNCSPVNGVSSQYSRPYDGLISKDPTAEEIRTVIVHKGERPSFNNALLNNETLMPLISIIQESWVRDPEQRPSALLLKNRLAKLLSNC